MSKVKLNDVAFEAKVKYKAVEGVPVRTVGLEHLTPSDIDLNDYAIGAKTTFAKGFSKDDILFGRRRAYQKKAAIAPFDGICSGDITVIRAIDGAINKKLLPFIIQNEYFFDYAMRNSAGSMSPRVKWAQLGEFEFELPSPSRQDELVNLMWAIQEARRDYKAIIDECGNVIKSRFVEMFKYPDWDELHIDALADVQGGLTKNKTREQYKLHLPYLRVANVLQGKLDLSEMLSIGLTEAERKKTLLRTGDLLFVEGNGSQEQIGRSAIWDGSISPCVHQNHLIRARFNERILPVFALEYFSSPAGRKQIAEKAVSTSGLFTLSTGKIKSLKIPVPPLPFQQEFADFVARIDKLRFDTRRALESLNSTSDAILNEELGLNHG